MFLLSFHEFAIFFLIVYIIRLIVFLISFWQFYLLWVKLWCYFALCPVLVCVVVCHVIFATLFLVCIRCDYNYWFIVNRWHEFVLCFLTIFNLVKWILIWILNTMYERARSDCSSVHELWNVQIFSHFCQCRIFWKNVVCVFRQHLFSGNDANTKQNISAIVCGEIETVVFICIIK